MGIQTTTSVALTGAWQQIAEDKTLLVIQSAPLFAEVFIGDAAPTTSSAGFRIPRCSPHMFPSLNSFGGNAWIRGDGVVWYSTDGTDTSGPTGTGDFSADDFDSNAFAT